MGEGPLYQRTLLEDNDRIAVKLPLTPELEAYQPGGYFPLIEDPLKEKRATIVGMFVLRPAVHAWTAPIVDEDGKARSMYDVKDWTFNVRGLDGGWLIAGGNALDAYRLALQYGVSDAVMVGSGTVAKEGVKSEHGPGYLWQPYSPVEWDHLKAADPHLLSKIEKQRREWQKLGYLSDRTYPAQIVVTQSGRARDNEPDFLDARIFKARHPNGAYIESYILTSETGAQRIKERASNYFFPQPIDKILITVSPPGKPDELDIARVPEVLYSEPYNMRIVNHDGGATVLSEFSRAGVLPQINLTLARQKSVADALRDTDRVDDVKKREVLSDFEHRVQHFWSKLHIPHAAQPAHILTDNDQVAVVTFDTRQLRGL